MTGRFVHEVREASERIVRSETWTAQIQGYDVIVSRDAQGSTSLEIAGCYPTPGFRGIIHCHPRDVDELEAFAVIATTLFTEIAAVMREAGLSDLRSKFDKAFAFNG